MKPLLPIFGLGLVLGGIAAADATDASVRFSNNDRLTGEVDSLTADLLVWKSPVLEKPTAFFLKEVLDLSLPTTQPPDNAEHEATLKLTNGDTVCGQLAAVTNDTVTLDTWFAGRMKFNRLMVASVKITDKMRWIYRGPSGLEGWKQNRKSPAWSYSRGALRSSAVGSITRVDVLPEECSISFDLAWKGDALSFKLNAFTDRVSDFGSPTGYEFSFQRGAIYLRNCKSNMGFMGNANSQAMMENDKVHVEIRVSTKSGKVCLLINDRLIEVWSDPDFSKGKFGRNLQFTSQNPTELRVSAIAIAAWDGTVDRVPEPRIGMMRQFGMLGQLDDTPAPPPQEKPKEGRMELANGDNLDGEVTSIIDGMIAVKTPLGDIKIPVARVRTLAMKKADLERCKRRNGDIRAWFPDGGSLVFRLDGVGDGSLRGSSQNFDSATFKISAFSRIEFNIHDLELEEKRATDDW